MAGLRATKLILVNGPPAVGKSTLARRYIDEHPLTLMVDIDAIRVSLGGWQDHPESMLLARAIGLAMAEAHLRFGYDVIVPQYLGRPEFIDALDHLAASLQVSFVETLLLDDPAAVEARFRARRDELGGGGGVHPQADVDDPDVAATIAASVSRLETVAAARPRTRVIANYDALCAAVG